jgi:hypothetical protein
MSVRPFSPVGVAVFGVSTLYGHWGFGLVREIVEAVTGDVLHLHSSTLDGLREGMQRRNGGSVVLTEDLPATELMEFICNSDLPIVTFCESAENIFDWVLSTRNPDRLDAARFCTYMISSLVPAFSSKKALHIVRHASSSERVVFAIVKFLFPKQADWLAEQIFRHLEETGKIDRYTPDDWDKYKLFKTETAQISDKADFYVEMRDLIKRYLDLIAGGAPAEIDWPQPLFYRPDNQPFNTPIDLMGPSRVLFYGPYVNLPIGDWTVRLEFEIDGAGSGIEATTDIYINEVVTQRTFKMPAKGIYAYELSFHIDDPQRAVQIRLFTKSGAIEGVLLPRSVRVLPGRVVFERTQ